jgi:hypothetical protein
MLAMVLGRYMLLRNHSDIQVFLLIDICLFMRALFTSFFFESSYQHVNACLKIYQGPDLQNNYFNRLV